MAIPLPRSSPRSAKAATRAEAGGYLKKSLPPLEFEYSAAVIGQDIHDVDPVGHQATSWLDGAAYQWVDLDGEGLSGVLTERGGGWFYKRNESALTRDAAEEYTARFAPVEQVARIPDGSPVTGAMGSFSIWPAMGRWMWWSSSDRWPASMNEPMSRIGNPSAPFGPFQSGLERPQSQIHRPDRRWPRRRADHRGTGVYLVSVAG